MDVLFLSVSAGGGHLKAAETIKEGIEQKFPGSKTLIVDTLKYANPVVDKLTIGWYLSAVKSTPQLWGKIYAFTETGKNVRDISKTVNKLLSFRIKNLINKFKPSVIVCTHIFPLQMLSDLKRKGKINIPTVAILTDYETHPFWLHDHIDAYVIAHEYMKFEMVQSGIPEEIIYPYGLPIPKLFLQKKDKSKILEEFGLDNKLTILVMSGSLGSGEVKEAFLSLLNSKMDMQIIVVTGHNLKLKKQLEKHSLNSVKKVKILGYTNRIADLMDISDFIMTKPGGMTVTESLIKELPIFIMSPIPGQEERNAHFLMNSGVAARISDNDNVDSVLSQIIDNPIRVRHMKEMCRFLAKPNSTESIVGLIERLGNKE